MSATIEMEVTLPLPATHLFGGQPDLQKYLQRRDARWLEAAGRLKAGVTLEKARAQLGSLWPAIRQEMTPPDKTSAELSSFRELQLKVESGAKGGSLLRHRFEKPLYALLSISALVLLVACVNLASLMLARAASRSHELSVRVALGAGRGRLASQMLTESLALSAAGAMAGCVLAYWASRALATFILGQIYIVPADLNLSPDWRILGFTTSAAIATGVLFGLAPAWGATHGCQRGSPAKRAHARRQDRKTRKRINHGAGGSVRSVACIRGVICPQPRKIACSRPGLSHSSRSGREPFSEARRL